MDTKEVKIGRCFTACTGREITSILEIHLMEGASHTIQGILKSVKTRPRHSLDYFNGCFSSPLQLPLHTYNGREYLEKL